MQKLKMWMLGRLIEQKWERIHRNRQRMGALIDRREPYSSDRLVSLDLRNLRLGDEVGTLQRTYLNLMRQSAT